MSSGKGHSCRFRHVRSKYPANYQLPPHTHPFLEVVTVISGAIGSSHGEKFEKKGGMLKAGSFWVHPAKHAHHVWTENEEAIVQAQFIGPGGIDYINPQEVAAAELSQPCIAKWGRCARIGAERRADWSRRRNPPFQANRRTIIVEQGLLPKLRAAEIKPALVQIGDNGKGNPMCAF